MLEERQNKGGLVGAVMVVAAIAVYVFVGRGFAEEKSTLQVELDSKMAELSVFTAQEQEIESASAELNLTSTVEQFTSLNAIPANIDQDEVIRTLIDIAERFDIDLSAINFSRASSELDSVDVLRVNASFSGNYGDLIDFLEGIEESDRLFKVSSINVQVAETGITGLERANFSLSIDTFYQI